MKKPVGTADNWIQDVLNRSNQVFYDSCNRWIDLYKSARTQADELARVETDPNRSRSDKNKARSRRSEALSQMDQLTKGGKFSSDFYSYRYFASEGFLPGYNFPRLPLSAFIPGQISNKPPMNTENTFNAHDFLLYLNSVPEQSFIMKATNT